MKPILTLNLPNGTGNRIKWRAADLAGNGPIESEAYAININTWKELPIPEVTLKYPQNDTKVNTLKPSLGWSLVYSGTYDITYDIYFGTTDSPDLIVKRYPETRYTPAIELEEGQTYYWRIVPHANGITGPSSPIWKFSVDSDYLPVFDLEVNVPISRIDIEQGKAATVNISIKNFGELTDVVLVEIVRPDDSIGVYFEFSDFEQDTAELEIATSVNLDLRLNILVDTTRSPGPITVTVRASSQRAKDYGLELERNVQFTINVVETTTSTPGTTKESNQIMFVYLFVIVLIILTVLIYNKLERSKILANIQRNAIYELIQDKPGIHFRKVMRALNLKPGTLSYHINVLEKEHFIKSIQKGEYRCFYPEGVKSDLRMKLTTLQQNIIFIISENPGISLTELSKTADRNKMVLFYNTGVLEDVGIIKKEKRGRIATFYITSLATPYLED